MSRASSHPSEADLARRSARRALIRRTIIALVVALVAFAIVHSFGTKQNRGTAQVATKLVTVTNTESAQDGIHVTARLDAPSPDGTSHQIDGVVAPAAWNLSHTLWACYPANDPKKGVLRTPFDPDCANLVAEK